MKNYCYCLLFFCLLLPSKLLLAQGGIDKPIYQIDTYRDTSFLGSFTVELFPLIAPLHVQNFDSLVGQNAFDSTAFHRIVPGFVIQGGDPNSISGPMSTWGLGQPTQPTVNAEFSAVRHLRGILGAARDADTNSANSQFYICVAPATFLDGNYTVYGKVTTGMTVVDTIVLSPRDANDYPLQKISMFVNFIGVNDSVPDSVSLVSPVNNAINISNTQTFSWTPSATAVLYTIEFSTDSLFSTITLSLSPGINQTTAPTLPGSATYFWRVKSNNGGHESSYSQVWKFSTLTAAVALQLPVDSAVNVLLNPVFEWSPVANATNYSLQVSTSSIFIPSQIQFNLTGLTDTVKQISTLNANTRYYWRVRSFNGSIAGYYSSKYTFETGTTLGVQSPENANMISALFPNPAAETLWLTVKPMVGENWNIKVSDLSGKVVYTEDRSYVPECRLSIDVKNFAKGVYLIEILNAGNYSSDKFVVE